MTKKSLNYFFNALLPLRLDLSNSESIANDDGTTTFLTNYDVPSILAEALGSNSITILAGDYEIDYSSNPDGTLLLNVESN